MDFELCTPAKFYLFFAFLSFLTALFYGQSFLFMIAQVIISALWIAGLNYLCKAGYVSVSWAVTLTPVWIGIIAYGLTFINLDGAAGGGTYAPTPGDFAHLKAATLTNIINSIFNQFTGKAQFSIKPVFDQVKKDRLDSECTTATTALGGWGTTHLYDKYDTVGAYYIQTAANETPVYTAGTDDARFNCLTGFSGGAANPASYPTIVNSCTAGSTAVGTTHRPIKTLADTRTTACAAAAAYTNN